MIITNLANDYIKNLEVNFNLDESSLYFPDIDTSPKPYQFDLKKIKVAMIYLGAIARAFEKNFIDKNTYIDLKNSLILTTSNEILFNLNRKKIKLDFLNDTEDHLTQDDIKSIELKEESKKIIDKIRYLLVDELNQINIDCQEIDSVIF